MVTDFVAWLGLDKTDINPNDVLAAGVDVINVASAGILSKIDGSTVDFSPILQTSSDAEIIPPTKVGFVPIRPRCFAITLPAVTSLFSPRVSRARPIRVPGWAAQGCRCQRQEAGR